MRKLLASGMPDELASMARLTWPTQSGAALALGSIAATLEAGSQLLIPLVLGSIVDEALIDQDPEALRSRTLLLVVLALSTFLGNAGHRLSFASLEERGLATCQHRLLGHVNRIPKSVLDRWRASELYAFFTEDAPKIASLPGRFLGKGVITLVQIVGLVSVLAWRYGAEAFLIAALVPLYVLLPTYLSPAIKRASRTFKDAGAATAARIQELVHATREIRIFGQERWALDSLDPFFESKWKERLRLELLRSLTMANHALTFVVGAAIYWYGGLLVFEGRLSVGELVALVALLTYLESPVQSIVRLNSEFQGVRASLNRLDRLLAILPEPRGGNLRLPDRRRLVVTFDQVGFNYARASGPALDAVSFSVPAGSTVGVVGPSGAGKSTLVALLLRLYEVTDGVIRLDGNDIRDYDISSLRAGIGFVPQDPLLLAGTVRDNIHLAAPEADDFEIERCCRLAGVDEFAGDLPAGYDTDLGDQAVRLSGGQRQRIAIARALVRRPALMILDEATAALDSVLEKKLIASLFPQDSTTSFIITHRVHAVTDCDLILVLDRGRLMGSGAHEDLLRTCELYRRLRNVPGIGDRERTRGADFVSFTRTVGEV